MDAEDRIKQHLKKLNLDLRKTKFSRFMDQKLTPDVLCFIADCIINLPNHKKFTTKDIWESDYFEKNIRVIFGKPSPKNKTAKNEYDKFIIQPLRMLYYAKVLDSKKDGKRYIYSVKEEDLLEFISIKERNAFIFLSKYIKKVLEDSGLLNLFESYKDKRKKGKIKEEDLQFLKNKYIHFMRGHTPINQDIEIRRIFPKVMNVYAVENSIPGTEKGYLSKHIFNFSDLMYNRQNWRDINKGKEVTRKEAAEKKETIKQKRIYYSYLIKKAIEKIKKKYKESEVNDSFAKGLAVHVHHIFPTSTYPQLAFFLENLIKLTATQHLQKAHPNGNTKIVNKDYQCVCLIAKSVSIEKSLNKGELFYTKPNFIYIINEGLNASLNNSLNFDEVRDEVNKIYNGF